MLLYKTLRTGCMWHMFWKSLSRISYHRSRWAMHFDVVWFCRNYFSLFDEEVVGYYLTYLTFKESYCCQLNISTSGMNLLKVIERNWCESLCYIYICVCWFVLGVVTILLLTYFLIKNVLQKSVVCGDYPVTHSASSPTARVSFLFCTFIFLYRYQK